MQNFKMLLLIILIAIFQLNIGFVVLNSFLCSSEKVVIHANWLDNLDMHMYATFDQNIQYDSSFMSIFTNCYRTD